MQVTREVKERRVVAQQVIGGGGVRVVVARQVRAHVARPRRREPAAGQRALEGARLRVRAQPVLGHARQEAHALALCALEQALGGVVGGDAGVRPRQRLLRRRPPVLCRGVRSRRKVRLRITLTYHYACFTCR